MNLCILFFRRKNRAIWLMLTNILHMVLHHHDHFFFWALCRLPSHWTYSPVVGVATAMGYGGWTRLVFCSDAKHTWFENKNNMQEVTSTCSSIFSCTVNKVLYWLCPQEIQRTRIRPTRTWMGHRSRIYGHQTDLFDDQFNSKMLRPWLPIFFHRFMIYLIFDVGFCRCRMFFCMDLCRIFVGFCRCRIWTFGFCDFVRFITCFHGLSLELWSIPSALRQIVRWCILLQLPSWVNLLFSWPSYRANST